MRAENRKRRTTELLSAATSMFLARGLEQVTIDEIVQAADVAKGSFYRYFADKEALVAALFAPAAERVRAAFATCDEALRAARTPEQLTRAYADLAGELGTILGEDVDAARLYLQECRGPAVGARVPVAALAAEIRRGAIALTDRAQALGLIRVVDARVSALAVIGATERLLVAYLTEEVDERTAALIPEGLVALVLDGIRAPPRG